MKLDRFRTPALAATAVLVISGAGIAFAAPPQAAAPQPAAPAIERATEPVGPDTDTLQQGDQTTPDVVVAPAAPGAVTAPAAKPAALKAAPEAAAPEAAAETSTEAEAASDGPGGHEDPPGANVDHQFEGEE